MITYPVEVVAFARRAGTSEPMNTKHRQSSSSPSSAADDDDEINRSSFVLSLAQTQMMQTGWWWTWLKSEECVCSNLTHTKRCTHTVRGEAGHSLGLLVYDVTGCVGEIYAYSFAFTEFVFFCKSYFKQNEPRHGESESTSDVVLT